MFVAFTGGLLDKTWNVAAACFAGAAVGWIVLTVLGFGALAIVAGTIVSGAIGLFVTDVAQSRLAVANAWRTSWPIVRDAVCAAPKETLAFVRITAISVWRIWLRPIVTLRPLTLAYLPLHAAATWGSVSLAEGDIMASAEVMFVMVLIFPIGNAFLWVTAGIIVDYYGHFLRGGSVRRKVFPRRKEVEAWCKVYVRRFSNVENDEKPWNSDDQKLEFDFERLHDLMVYNRLPWRTEWYLVWRITLKPLVSIPIVIVYGFFLLVWLVISGFVRFFIEELPAFLWDVAPACARASGRFVRTLFVGVHTRWSLMAMVDAPLGMLVTYVTLRAALGSRLLELDPSIQLSYLVVAGAVSLMIGVFNCRVVVPWLKTSPI